MTEIAFRVLAEASLRVGVLAILVSALIALLRVRPSAARHAVWTGFLLAMLAMPVLPSILPRIAIPTPAEIPLVSSQSPRAEIHSLAAAGVSQPAAPARSGGLQTGSGLTSSAATVGTAAISSVALPPPGTRWPWITILMGAYAAGVFVSLLVLLVGWREARRLKLTGRSITINAVNGASVAVDSRVRIRESASVTTPLTIAVFKTTIVLPLSWRSWPVDTLRAVLAHETAHVRRHDPLIFFLSRVNRCVFWFHPVAWWLERRLAATAEYASDECAVRTIGNRQRYAEILLDMARTVQRTGGRLSWQAIGISGNGLLGRRIDRVLIGIDPPLPATRKFTVAGSCATVLLLAAACQLVSSAAPYGLTPSEAQREEQIRTELEQLSRRQIEGLGPFPQVTREGIASLETAAGKNSDDMDAAKALLVAYWHFGERNVNAHRAEPERPPADPRIAAARRDFILRLIENHPESDLTGSVEGRIFPTSVLPHIPADPEGYQRAKAAWLQHVEKPSVSAAVMGNASYFFETSEPALAEQLLLRARTRDPDGPWAVRLGRLYGSALTSFSAPRYAQRIKYYQPDDPFTRPDDPFTQAVRRTLGETTDETILTAAGWFLAQNPRAPRGAADPDGWAESCFKRVLFLNPRAVFAHAEMLSARENRQRNARPLWNPPLTSRYETVAALPDADRFDRLPELARNAYHAAVSDARWNDQNLADHMAIEKTQARLFAEDALKLAPQFRDHPKRGTAILSANLTLGSLALAGGNRQQALEYLRKASRAPASEELVYGEDIACGMFIHLPGDLLALGERAAVVDYLERMAAIDLADQHALRLTAAAIRRGESPNLSSWSWRPRR